MKPTDDQPQQASESPSSSRPASSGLNTSGPRIAPNTAPKRTSAMPCAAPLGRVHVAGRGAREQRRAARRADARRARRGRRAPTRAREPSAASAPPSPPIANPPASTGTRPMRSISAARPAARRARPRRARSPGRARAAGRRRARARASATRRPPRAAASPSWPPAPPTAGSVLRRIGSSVTAATLPAALRHVQRAAVGLLVAGRVGDLEREARGARPWSGPEVDPHELRARGARDLAVGEPVAAARSAAPPSSPSPWRAGGCGPGDGRRRGARSWPRRARRRPTCRPGWWSPPRRGRRRSRPRSRSRSRRGSA